MGKEKIKIPRHKSIALNRFAYLSHTAKPVHSEEIWIPRALVRASLVGASHLCAQRKVLNLRALRLIGDLTLLAGPFAAVHRACSGLI